MGSVLDYISCPKCGNEAYDEYHYKSGEEFLSCPHCGYTRKFFITNWDEKEESEWMPNFDLKEYGGIGAYKVRYKDDVGYEIGSFLDEDGPAAFISMVESNKDNLDHAEYTQLVDNILERTIIIHGEIEKAYEETQENKQDL